MARINSFEELKSLKEKYKKLILHRFTEENKSCNQDDSNTCGSPSDQNGHKHHGIDILVCGGTGCQATESIDVVEVFEKEVEKEGLQDKVHVITTGCFGFCEKGPIVKIMPDNVFYIEITPEKAKTIIKEHIVAGKPIEEFLYQDPETEKRATLQSDIPFYKKQMRIALRNCGLINPENIDEYIAMDGYEALGKSLIEWTPEKVIDELKKSGLRGRGGGGFPTGIKWEMSRKSQAEVKYIICNADEGDPGAFMDRSILEGDPHSVLEAMAISGYCVGSNKGYIYIRAEYPLAIQRLRIAIKQAYDRGLLGENILGSNFSFHIDLKYGAGAFVCGEETALINSIEGGRGEPTVKPPYPAQIGLWKKPTNINNVETFANINPILLRGADWFSSIGTEKSK